jgi:hypothetical protein
MKLKLYRVKAQASATYGETNQAVVYAKSPEDALVVFNETMERENKRENDPHGPPENEGYWAAYAGPYDATEVPVVRGPVLAEGQDG